MIFTRRPFPTPDEFNTVWLPKRQERDNRENHKSAKSIMRLIAARLRGGNMSTRVLYPNTHTKSLVEKQLAAFGWKARWFGGDGGITVSRLDSQMTE